MLTVTVVRTRNSGDRSWHRVHVESRISIHAGLVISQGSQS